MNKWMVNCFIAAMAVAFGSAGWAADAERALTLKIGDPAPEYKVETWLKGTPVPRLERGHMYLLEFWATKCAPCIKAFPHLKALSQQYAGTVTFIAIGVPYEYETIDDVKKFVSEHDDLMSPVALDTLHGKGETLFSQWGPPAGVHGYPLTVIVDGSGKIAWIGTPTGVDEPLKQIVAGTFDIAAARQQQQADHDAAQSKDDVIKSFQTLLGQKAYAEIIKRVDNLVARNPEMESEIYGFKLKALVQTDANEAVAYAQSLPQDTRYGAVERLAGEENLPASAYQFVAEQLEQLVATDPDAHPVSWQMLAITQHRLGNVDRAIQALETSLAKSDAMNFEEFSAQLRTTLQEYQVEKNGTK